MKLLTVTVPCYNSQDYMENCIDSLLPGGDRVEIIIIDDGSKDQTGAIADRYAAAYPGIVRVIHQENGGHGEGINQGLRHATGTYFKVVDSDDRMSGDFVRFLDTLEECEKLGGVDLVVSNYYYTHTDGIGDRSIDYRNALPEGKILSWEDTRPFRIHQMLTIHSCTFRTQVMRACGDPLPKHIFYEDNLMVCQTLPHVKRLYYFRADLYRYTIGRAGQSVALDSVRRRYDHQIEVTRRCFTAFHLDTIASPRLKKYLKHELFMMLGISIFHTRLNKSQETDRAMEKMWQNFADFDPKYAARFRRSPLGLLCLPGSFGQNLTCLLYRAANRIVRFN